MRWTPLDEQSMEISPPMPCLHLSWVSFQKLLQDIVADQVGTVPVHWMSSPTRLQRFSICWNRWISCLTPWHLLVTPDPQDTNWGSEPSCHMKHLNNCSASSSYFLIKCHPVFPKFVFVYPLYNCIGIFYHYLRC